MKKASQWIFGLMFAVALLFPVHNCYAYEGESEEEWVNRMWYNTQWTCARAIPGGKQLLGHTITFAKLFGDYTGYSDVMPWVESGIITCQAGGKPAHIEIMAGSEAIAFSCENEAMWGFMNMAASQDRRR